MPFANRAHFARNRRLQQGQAAVYVYLFLAVLVVSLLFLYKAGKLTSDKIQLQNAADAAAYSASLVEARDLNFAAYMNRAIVANEVAIGQMVGLASWAYHWRSFADFLMAYDTLILGPATLGISTPIMQGITNVAWRIPGNAFIKVLSPVANISTSVLHNINKAYGLAEYGHHIVSLVFVVGTLDEMLKQNGPEHTKLSDFGLLSLITHMTTYGALPLLPGQQFSIGYSPTKKVPVDEFKEGGYGRLAALVAESRDPFTKGRGWELRPPGFPINVKVGDKWTVLGTGIEWEMRFFFDLSLERKGGSELRIVIPASGDISARNFNWSSADATGLFLELAGGFDLWAYLLGAEVFSAGGDLSVGNSRLKIVVRVDTGFKEFDVTIVDVPFPTSAPFGAGFVQAGKKGIGSKPNAALKYKDMLIDPAGSIETKHYGEAANNLLAWMSPGQEGVPFPPLGIAASTLPNNDSAHRVNKSYAGLPHFVDTTGNESFLGIGAPYLIIGLVLDESDYDLGRDGTKENEPVGRLALTEKIADQELAVVAKSEVYFSRPTDNKATHFWRADGQEEYGSGFNPYWQARLVETSYTDRVLALLVQQKQDFLNLGASFNLLFNNLMSYLPGGAP